jgi:RHS repeat-associated protein
MQVRYGVTGSFAGITEQNAYNKRLQPITLSAGAPSQTVFSISYDFHLGSDNGNVFQIVNNLDNNRTQNFLYDPLNRIQQAYTSGPNWGETFSPTATAPGVVPSTPGIDAWGNLTNRSGVTGKSMYESLSAAATTQNRLSGFGYDAAGNMISNGSATYTYNAENQLISAAGYTYTYDGDGNRIKKTNGSTGTIYWRDASGNSIDEANLSDLMQNEYIFFGGKRIAREDSQTGHRHYYLSDHLGSASVITSDLGAIQEQSDYYPYGGEIPITNGDPNTYKFTGKERDAESGLDNFGKRYDSSNLSRFMTPDTFYKDSHVADPQSWNEYAYARNNPLRYVDPTGEDATVSSTCETSATMHTTCSGTISGSIAIYAQPGSGLTQEQLNQAAGTIQNTIQNAWSGSFTQGDVTYNVNTQVSVSVASGESAAVKSGAQNVIGLSNGPADAAHNFNSEVFAKSPGTKLFGGPDRGIWNFNTLASDSGHEFAHLLGTFDKPGTVLSNTDILNDPNIPHTATSRDFNWGIQEVVRAVNLHLGSVQHEQSLGWPTPNPFTRTETVGAPLFWWK